MSNDKKPAEYEKMSTDEIGDLLVKALKPLTKNPQKYLCDRELMIIRLQQAAEHAEMERKVSRAKYDGLPTAEIAEAFEWRFQMQPPKYDHEFMLDFLARDDIAMTKHEYSVRRELEALTRKHDQAAKHE